LVRGRAVGKLTAYQEVHQRFGLAQVFVEYREQGQLRPVRLGHLPYRQEKAYGYRGALYQGQEKEPVDIIAYRERGFKEPWFLLVPPDSEAILSTESAVRLCRANYSSTGVVIASLF